MFHPAAPSSPCGSFSSLTALTRLASRSWCCESFILTATSSTRVSFHMLPWLTFMGRQTPLISRHDFFLRKMVSQMLLSWNPPHFHSSRFPAATNISIPHATHTPFCRRDRIPNLVNQNLACSAISGHTECTHQSSPSTFPQSLCVMV